MVADDPELTSKEIAEMMNKPRTTVTRWLRERRDIFPNARKTGAGKTDAWVAPKSDVVAYMEKYPPIRR